MIEVKTAELIGPALDWAVAKVEGISTHKFREKTYALFGSLAIPLGDAENGYAPSTCWHCCGPLIDKYIGMIHASGGSAEAMVGGFWNPGEEPARETGESFGAGSTVLIAACRAIVAAKLGDVVSVPAELVQGGAA